MAKRRLTNQQQRRITSSQKNRLSQKKSRHNKETNYELDEASTQSGIVVSHHGKELVAEIQNKTRIKCRIRQNLGDLACGDRVLIQAIIEDQKEFDETAAHHVVIAIEDRDNLLTKTGFGGSIKAVAANISQVIIVASVQPEPNPYLIDRYIAATENLPAQSILVINKIDLHDIENNQKLKHIQALYESIGYQVILTSVKSNTGITELQQSLSGHTSILVGLSGVGKSSLVKAILPEQEIRIGETSVATGEGKHTTTVSALYHLGNDGIIMDSPGVRDFTPSFDEASQITQGFREIREHAAHCKFSNCSHRDEPGCAVQQAIKDKLISQERCSNYLRLLDELNNMQNNR